MENKEQSVGKKSRNKREKEEEGWSLSGRWGILVVLVVTVVISLALYLKRRWSGEFDFKLNLGGVERITFEK